jgi:hypothetical protein
MPAFHGGQAIGRAEPLLSGGLELGQVRLESVQLFVARVWLLSFSLEWADTRAHSCAQKGRFWSLVLLSDVSGR